MKVECNKCNKLVDWEDAFGIYRKNFIGLLVYGETLLVYCEECYDKTTTQEIKLEENLEEVK